MAGEGQRRTPPPSATRTRVSPSPVPGPYPPRRGTQFEEAPPPTRQGRSGVPVPAAPRTTGSPGTIRSTASAPRSGAPWGAQGQGTQPLERQQAPRPAGPRKPRSKVAREGQGRLIVRRVSVGSVFKISLAFYLCVLVVVLVAGAVLWNVAASAGLIVKLDKLVRSLFALSSFKLHPLTALVWGGAFVAALCLLGVLVNVVVVLLYNVLSELIGGVRVLVVSDENAGPASLGYQAPPDRRPPRGYSSAG